MQNEAIMCPVKSSNIKAVGYDDETATLIIEFQSGAIWTFDQVPASTHAALMEADSIGRFFAKEIKPVYQATRIPRPLPDPEPVNVLAAG